MTAWTSRPSDQQPRGGLIVLQEAFGVNSHIRDVAERFANEGFCVIAPELFHRSAAERFEGSYNDFAAVAPHVQAVTEAGLFADLRAAYKWLSDNAETGDIIASVGYCMGGRASFLANSILQLKAAISYYGGNIPPLLQRAPKLSGPMLFFWGELDSHIPIEQRRQVAEALKSAGKRYVEVTFSNAGHGFFCDERASYDIESAGLSWDMTLSFLKRYVR